MPFLLAVLLLSSSARAAGFHAFVGGVHAYPADKIFVPSKLAVPAALVVVLHGCEQDADKIAAVTRWNELAEKNGFYVLYPNQQMGRNIYNCWNWFLPANQRADFGEPAEVALAVGAVRVEYKIDAKRVYVAGISAGGALAATLLACYPGTFAAGGVHSGVSYGLTTTASDALDLLKKGPEDRPAVHTPCDPVAYHGGVFVIHGDADPAINPLNAKRIAADFSSAGKARTLMVPGMGHAWSGGAPGLPYSYPEGPDATALMWNFFSR